MGNKNVRSMSWEALTALATLGTFFVILVSAIAALRQLRHTGAANQVAALLEFRETLETPRSMAARRFIMIELSERLSDPVEARKLARVPFPDEYQDLMYVANLFETFGLLVRHRIVDEKLACESFGYVILSTWNALLPVITCVRRTTEMDVWGSFEYMAHLAKVFNERSGGAYSTYPARLERMPQDSSLYDRVRGSEYDT